MATFLKERLGLASVVLPNFVPRPEGGAKVAGDHYVFVGVLEPHKGLDLLLKGYEIGEVRSELHVLGRGSLEPMVSEYGRRTGGRIKALGFLDRKELLAEVSSAIAILSPSTCQENSPLSCIEALSVGTPLIVSANGGLPELVADGAGIVADTTPESIGSAMRTLERQEKMRSTFSGNALRRYEDVHTPESYLRSYLELVEAAE
jgi:glycosyltransferase involved in cell wall biosynthesis